MALELFTIAGTAITAGDVLLAASTLAGVVGGVQQGSAMKAAGQAQYQSSLNQAALAEASAKALEQSAGQERAAAQRAAAEQRRQGRHVSSRAQAVAAASGAGALDPTIVNILGDLDTETEYRALTAMYEGEEKARGMETEAGIRRAGGAADVYAGEAAKRYGGSRARAAYMGATGTLLSGGATLYDRYSNRPKKAPSFDDYGPIGVNYG